VPWCNWQKGKCTGETARKRPPNDKGGEAKSDTRYQEEHGNVGTGSFTIMGGNVDPKEFGDKAHQLGVVCGVLNNGERNFRPGGLLRSKLQASPLKKKSQQNNARG